MEGRNSRNAWSDYDHTGEGEPEVEGCPSRRISKCLSQAPNPGCPGGCEHRRRVLPSNRYRVKSSLQRGSQVPQVHLPFVCLFETGFHYAAMAGLQPRDPPALVWLPVLILMLPFMLRVLKCYLSFKVFCPFSTVPFMSCVDISPPVSCLVSRAANFATFC